MPLYDYLCANCGKTCEMLEKVSAAPAVTCPNCGKDQLKRQVSAPSFQLKGTGWYVTDFKNKDKPAGKTTTSEPAAKSEETKPAAETPKTPTEKDS